MKRRYADYRETAIAKKRTMLTYMQKPEFTGWAYLLCIDEIASPMIDDNIGIKMCIADNGYVYIRYFPDNENYCIMAIFNEKHQAVEWYIDITTGTQFTEDGLPFYDDIYLDIEVLPSGEIFYLDEDELEDALNTGDITQNQYNKAIKDGQSLLTKIVNNEYQLLAKSQEHLVELLQEVNNSL
ncbi:DUF402 domain-containing protein [Clostridium sp. 'deep sea']|uniref:DUF402 domain-containing protein n=1 Tax=Clostridium sp. 'deep sea' TaxID=2779445 RepID=UPI001896A3E6|nr:DUF402 domain-containing protein [Clostridium sp. 'deep sea']QOR35378.1 DUF402 domain-containing protein [Clostridium sp. 'deep sea']